MEWLYILLPLLLALIMAVGMAKDLLYGAVALALGSVVLSMVMYPYAPMAAVFELSVCAGLITVLFVISISLTKDSDQKEESRVTPRLLPFFMLLFLGIDFFALHWLQNQIGADNLNVTVSGFRTVFWGERTTDILGQLALVLAGVFAILALFKRPAVSHGRKHD